MTPQERKRVTGLYHQILRLKETLRGISQVRQPPNPLDAPDKLDRVKRLAEHRLKIEKQL